MSGGPADEFIAALRELSFNVNTNGIDSVLAFGVIKNTKVRIGFSPDPMAIDFQDRPNFGGLIGFEAEGDFDKWSTAHRTKFDSVANMLKDIAKRI